MKQIAVALIIALSATASKGQSYVISDRPINPADQVVKMNEKQVAQALEGMLQGIIKDQNFTGIAECVKEGEEIDTELQ